MALSVGDMDGLSTLQVLLALLAILLSSLLAHRKISDRIAATKSKELPPAEVSSPSSSSPRGPRLIAAKAARLGGTAAKKAARLGGSAVARGRNLLRAPVERGRDLLHRRSHSTPPERPQHRRAERMRALSPNVRVKQRFGQHVANALGEGHSGRRSDLRDYYAADGLRLTKEASRQRLAEARPTLPKFMTSPDAAAGVPQRLLPSDASPWDRLHVWLVQGENLPYRPWLWPFEPYVVVTAQPEVDMTPLSVESFEFQTSPEFSSSTNPVWDEQGMVCFRRGGASTGLPRRVGALRAHAMRRAVDASGQDPSPMGIG